MLENVLSRYLAKILMKYQRYDLTSIYLLNQSLAEGKHWKQGYYLFLSVLREQNPSTHFFLSSLITTPHLVC